MEYIFLRFIPVFLIWILLNGTYCNRGQNYVLTRLTAPGKLSRILTSQNFGVTQKSCLQFDFFGQSKSTVVTSLSVKLKTVGWITEASQVIWVVHGVVDSNWHLGRASIKAGFHYLEFHISGNEYRGGFDKILVFSGECPPLNCTAKVEFACPSVTNQVCIGFDAKCDGVANCPGGEDESKESCPAFP